MREQLKRSCMLFLAAFIWGVAFVAQSEGMEYVGGFTFTCIRSVLGAAVLAPLVFVFRKINSGKEMQSDDRPKNQKRDLIVGGISCGTVLCIATNLQQFGIKYTTVGKAGFITALYIVLVPIFGMFLRKKVGTKVWIGLVFAVAGLYCLCINEALTVEKGDLLVLACAAIFAVHILLIDHFSPKVDGVALSCIQFLTAGVLSAIPMFLFEEVSMDALLQCAIPLLYAGILSSGGAYTLQILGQKNMNPTVACMIMSLESVVSVLAGLVILHQMLSPKELIGCVLMFIAVILAQLPDKLKRQKD